MNELKDLRHSVFWGLKNFGYNPFVFEINGVASPNSPLRACLDEVEEADFFVAIFTERLGGITEEEYCHAKKVGKRIFVFIDETRKKQPELESFLEKEFRNPAEGQTPGYFEYSQHLVDLIHNSIDDFVKKTVRKKLKNIGVEEETRRLIGGFSKNIPTDEKLIVASGNLFYETAGIIDSLIKLSNPNNGHIKMLQEALESEALEQYFFKHLAESANTAWFPLLREEGYFDVAPAPIEVEGGIRYPSWPALSYLVAVTPELQNEVIEVSENIQVQNAFWFQALVGAFTKMSIDKTENLAPIVISWLQKGLLVTRELVDLIKYWIDNQQWEQALLLLDAMLIPEEVPVPEEQRQSKYFSPRARLREHSFITEKFIQIISGLPDAPWLEIIEVFENKLSQVLGLEENQEQYEKASYWRSSIEPSSQNKFGDRVKDLLLNTIIDMLDKLLPAQKIQFTDKYLHHSLSIFRRLAIHLIREDESLWDRYLDDLYADSKYWKDIDYYHEYWLLTRDTFSALTNIQRQSYLARLLAELDSEEKDDDEKHYARHWLYRRLWPIKAHLPAKEKEIFDKLREEFKDPDPPDWFSFLAYTSGFRNVINSSSKTSKELTDMSSGEVLSELKKDFPLDRTSFDEPTIDGLSEQLGTAVKEFPARFTDFASELFDEKVHPLYIVNTVRGLRDAWKEKQDFEWVQVLKLCEAVSQTSEDADQDGTPPDMHSMYWYNTYASARKEIVDLLSTAVSDDEHAIPHEHLDQVRDILIQLCDDLNPSPESEAKRTSEDGWNYLSLSLNVTRAKAVAALIDYALHRIRIVNNDENAKDLLPEGVRIEPQVRGKLTERLDRKLEKNKSVHVNFGLYLPNLNYLDKEWLLSHLEDIFPRSSEMVEYWEAAWEGYTYRGTFYQSLLSELKPYYSYAIEQLESSDEKELKNYEKRLAEHLAFAYVNGEEQLVGEDSLVAKFFNIASDSLRGAFVETLDPVRIPPASQEPSSIEWMRIKNLWFQRHEYIQKQNNPDGFKEELAKYLLWVPHLPESLEPFETLIQTSAKFADDWPLSQLFEYFAKVIDKHPALIMSLYEEAFRREDLRLYYLGGQYQIRTILEAARYSQDQNARESAIRVINLFGERGDESYRDLL